MAQNRAGQLACRHPAVPSADFITSAQNLNYVVPAYASADQRGLPVDATHGQVFIPYSDSPAYNAKLVAAGLTPPTKSILSGWEVSGTVISETGLPWAGGNAPGYGGADTGGLGGNYTIRPDMAKKVRYPKKKTGNIYQWVSGDAFQAPTAAWLGGANLGFGNAGRDAVVGPGRTNFGTNLYKSFAIGERTHFELRAESFNTFNHTQFNALRTNWSGADFGQASGAQAPRTFEIGGKFAF
jgi:hypothetical protein